MTNLSFPTIYKILLSATRILAIHLIPLSRLYLRQVQGVDIETQALSLNLSFFCLICTIKGLLAINIFYDQAFESPKFFTMNVYIYIYILYGDRRGWYY